MVEVMVVLEVMVGMMVELTVVVDTLASFLILMGMVPKFSSGHDVCCHFSG